MGPHRPRPKRAGPAPRFGSRLVSEEVLFLQAATPCSPDFTQKTVSRSPAGRPHPRAVVPNELRSPCLPVSLHWCLTHQLSPARATPYLARATPRALSPGRGIPGRPRHLPCLPRARSPAPAPGTGRGVRGRPARQATPRGGGPRLRGWGPRAHGPAARAERHSPLGRGGPLLRAGAAGRRRASGPAGTWQGGDERCLREGAAETGREAAGGGERPAGAPVRQLFQPSAEPVRGLPPAPLGPPLPARCWLRRSGLET